MFTILMFLICSTYLIRHFISVHKAVELSRRVIFPATETEYKRILLPGGQWEEMQTLSRKTKSYQVVKWGTILSILVMLAFTIFTVTDEQRTFSFITIGYVFFSFIELVKHPGNFYLLEEGFIINGKFYRYDQVVEWKAEKVVRWSELYGLDDRVNHGYKWSVKVKRTLFQPSFVVIEDDETLNQVVDLLEKHTSTPVIQAEARTS